MTHTLLLGPQKTLDPTCAPCSSPKTCAAYSASEPWPSPSASSLAPSALPLPRPVPEGQPRPSRRGDHRAPPPLLPQWHVVPRSSMGRHAQLPSHDVA